MRQHLGKMQLSPSLIHICCAMSLVLQHIPIDECELGDSTLLRMTAGIDDRVFMSYCCPWDD